MPADSFEHNFESATGQIALDRPARILTDISVKIGDATVKENIAFVMGVVAPLRGDRVAGSDEAPRQRDFVEITPYDFNEKMKTFRPTASMDVDVTGGGNPLSLNLTFESLDDFTPAAVARKVDSLRQLLELRTQLSLVRTRFGADPDAKDQLKALFNKVMSDPKLAEELRNKLSSPK